MTKDRFFEGMQVFFEPRDRSDYKFRTWRFLRVAMVAMVFGLGWSVGYEVVKNPRDCWQTSLSAYYYTPVQAIFVGALVTIGVCLFSIKGRSPFEDALLNFAGVLAPIVAIVPTPDSGTCASILGNTTDRDFDVANNMSALFAVGAVLIVFVVVLMATDGAAAGEKVGYALAFAVYVVGLIVFFAARDAFLRYAHYAAAITMFVCIIGVAAYNAVRPVTVTVRWRAIYTSIASAMVLVGVLAAVTVPLAQIGWLDWDHAVIVVEIALIALFAVFWLAQTIENWSDEKAPAAAAPTAPAPTAPAPITTTRGTA